MQTPSLEMGGRRHGRSLKIRRTPEGGAGRVEPCPECADSADSGDPATSAGRPQNPSSLVPKIVQISDLKKRRIFFQNGSPLEARWGAKISKICQKCFPKASLGPLPKNVSKYVAFLTLQTLENQAPA